ncbi:hypothetical protein M8J77_024657 [Diaphorina citri]|nr:hypothetical protein M8J77_024657 [Diaphorina citri]
MPKIIGREIPAEEHELFALPARLGGLGIGNPENNLIKYNTSILANTKLIESICSGTDLNFAEHNCHNFQTIDEARKTREHQEEATCQEVLQKLPEKCQRSVRRVIENKASQWLTVLPTASDRTDLTAAQFRDALAVRYGREPDNLPSVCDGCGERGFNLNHALNCKKGGLIKRGHDQHRDDIKDWAELAWGPSVVEPVLRDANINEPALIGDLMLNGVWEPARQAFFDVRIVNADAASYGSRSWSSIEHSNAREKHAKYDRAAEDARSSFTPLILSCDCAIGVEYMSFLKRTADRLCMKWNRSYAQVLAIIEESIADHHMIGITISSKTSQHRNTGCDRKTITKINEKKVQEEILKIQWQDCYQLEDSVLFYEDLCNKFASLYSKCKEDVVITKKDEVCPWIDQETKEEIVKKKSFYTCWKNDKNNKIKYEVYKIQRNIVTNKIKKKKRIYFYRLFRDRAGNIQKTWNTINVMLERKAREDNEVVLKRYFKTDNVREIANNLNNNFIDQIKKLKEDNHGPSFTLQFEQHQQQKDLTSFLLKKATDMDIERILNNLNNTGPGIDGIRLSDLKNYRTLFIPIIKKLLNLIIASKIIPDGLKISSITALHKKGPVNKCSNYRPIGNLPILEKILEKYLHKNISKYLEEHQIIPEFQHGFQKCKSTMTLLEDLSELIIPALDNRMFVVMCAVDLKSAFDALEHPVLLEKFRNVGIQLPLLDNYFTNRTQVVKIGRELSNKRNIEFGLVQGGINSPLWYNLYTYDIKYLQMNGEIKMFADDTAIINIHKNLDIAIKNTQEDLITLQKYFYNNSIFINNEKTEILTYLTSFYYFHNVSRIYSDDTATGRT